MVSIDQRVGVGEQRLERLRGQGREAQDEPDGEREPWAGTPKRDGYQQDTPEDVQSGVEQKQ